MGYLAIIWEYIVQYLKSRLIYRVDFFNELFSDLITQVVNLLVILVVFEHTESMAGWSREEVLFIYGYFLIPYAIYSTFFDFWDFNERYIINGEMDRVLTRPVHHLVQIILERTQPEALFGAITGLVIMVYAGKKLNLSLTWYDPFVFIALVLGSVGVYAGIYIAIASIGFYSDSKTGISPMVYNIQNYGRYPIDIYNRLIRFVLTWVLPFAFVGMFPSAYFLKRSEWYMYTLATPVVGLIVFYLGVKIWNMGVRHYRGAGS